MIFWMRSGMFGAKYDGLPVRHSCRINPT
jgi:hypothetical protein